MDYVLVAGGLTLLVVAGDWLVRGAVSMAQKMGVPPIAIGLTVVAFGTSAPELIVGVDGVLSGVPELTLGNVIGSNIANSLLVIGLPAMIMPIACNATGLNRNIGFMLFTSLLVIALAWVGEITPVTGIIFLALLISFVYTQLLAAKEDPEIAAESLEELEGLPVEPYSWGKTTFYIILGLIGLSLGAHFLIEGAVSIARRVGVSEVVIGLTLVALGTSLPELMTALIAAVKRQGDVGVGNVVGSNIFNLLGILGTSSLFGTLFIPQSLLELDLWIMVGSGALLLPFTLRKAKIGRLFGAALLSGYVVYIIYLGQSALSHTGGAPV